MKYFTLIVALFISFNANAGMSVDQCQVLESSAKQIMIWRQAGESKSTVLRKVGSNKIYQAVVEMAFTQYSVYGDADLARRAAKNFGYGILRQCLKTAS